MKKIKSMKINFKHFLVCKFLGPMTKNKKKNTLLYKLLFKFYKVI